VIPPVLSGANIAFIAGLHNKMIFSFHAQPDIQNPAQLRGKVVAQIGREHRRTTEIESLLSCIVRLSSPHPDIITLPLTPVRFTLPTPAEIFLAASFHR
jgi:hypothetical protein